MLRDAPRELFDAYVDNEMHESQRADFESALARDEWLGQEFHDYLESIRLVRRMPMHQPPDRFLLLVQQRIRRRSRGRYFNYYKTPSLVVEAAVCAVLIFLMAAMYLVGAHVPRDSEMTASDNVERVRVAPADKRWLSSLGQVELVSTSITGTELEVVLVIDAAREDDVRSQLAASSRHTWIPGSTFRRGDRIWVRVRVPPGPRSNTF